MDDIDLIGSGKITVVLVMNLGRFMAEDDLKSRHVFRSVRGSTNYANYLRNLSCPDLFTRLDDDVLGSDPWIERQGVEIGVFYHNFYTPPRISRPSSYIQIASKLINWILRKSIV